MSAGGEPRFAAVASSAVRLVVDPFVVVPISLSIAHGDSVEKRRAAALQASRRRVRAAGTGGRPPGDRSLREAPIIEGCRPGSSASSPP